MYRFWDTVTRRLLEAAEPASVVEIGAAGGRHTRLLAEFCSATGAVLHVVDPEPRFDTQELLGEPNDVTVHRGRSLEVLPLLGPVDVALIDGDHNYYTVSRELRLLRQAADDVDRPCPLIACHDVCWPYGRRDLYYDPESIPEEHRHPWRRAGVVPGRDELLPGRGLNCDHCNAAHEGGPRNGVMTAIEDFVAATPEPISVTVLPVVYGLALLGLESRLRERPELERALGHWSTAEGWRELAELAEAERRRLDVAIQTLRRKSGTE